MPSTSQGPSKKPPQTNNIEGWIGHALDPLGVLFDTLMEASINAEDPTPTGNGLFPFLWEDKGPFQKIKIH